MPSSSPPSKASGVCCDADDGSLQMGIRGYPQVSGGVCAVGLSTAAPGLCFVGCAAARQQYTSRTEAQSVCGVRHIALRFGLDPLISRKHSSSLLCLALRFAEHGEQIHTLSYVAVAAPCLCKIGHCRAVTSAIRRRGGGESYRYRSSSLQQDA